MDGNEVRRLAREKILRELFGDTFRHDDPMGTLGGVIGQVVTGFGTQNAEAYNKALGKIEGLKLALEFVHDATKEAYQPPSEI